MWVELDGYLREAERAVAGEDQRHRDRVALHRDGFDYGRALHEFRRDFYPPGRDPDYKGAMKAFPRLSVRAAYLKKKYTVADEYWPTVLAPYFYGEIDRLATELKEKAEQAEKEAVEGKAEKKD